MSALTRFDRIDDMFPDMFRRFFGPMPLPKDTPTEIRVDVSESDRDYTVRAEMPGVKKDDIRVAIDGNFVSISAEVKQEKEPNGRSLVRELYYGSVARGFSLAHEVDDKEAKATFENGVLCLTLPKRRAAASKLVPIA